MGIKQSQKQLNFDHWLLMPSVNRKGKKRQYHPTYLQVWSKWKDKQRTLRLIK